MLNVNRFSLIALKVSAVTMLTLIMLSGCSTASMKSDEYHLEGLKQTPVSQTNRQSESRHYARQSTNSALSEVNLSKNQKPKVDKIITASTNSSTNHSVRKFEVNPEEFSSNQEEANSAACRYFKSSADAQAIITASPTLSASSDDDGSGSVSIGMNVLDLNKSRLLRDSADVKCRLYEASKKIEATLGLGTQFTKYASSNAKQQYIRKNTSKLNSYKREADGLMQQGAISLQNANLIKLQVDELYAEMEKEKAEADRLRELPSLNQNQIQNRHSELAQATTDLQNIQREIRTNEALELSVSGGYRYNNQFDDDFQKRDDPGTYAKVNVSVRLGALSPHRVRSEDAAASAKLDSLYEENTGIIWKSDFTKRSISRALVHLKRSEYQLNSALLRTNNTIKNLTGTDRPEILVTLIQTKIKNVEIGSELASVRASIRELNTNQQKIGALEN